MINKEKIVNRTIAKKVLAKFSDAENYDGIIAYLQGCKTNEIAEVISILKQLIQENETLVQNLEKIKNGSYSNCDGMMIKEIFKNQDILEQTEKLKDIINEYSRKDL